MPSCISIWQGLYTTLVLALSFITILALFSELAFLDCKYSQVSESLNICTGRLTQRAIKLIFSSIENKNFFSQPWFIVWLFNVSYLYQGELLLRRFLNNKRKSIFKKQDKININDATSQDFNSSQDDIEIAQNNQNKKKQRQILAFSQQSHPKNKRNKLAKIIFNLLALSSAGIHLFTKFPEMKSNLTLYLSSPNISPQTQHHPAVLEKAVNQAINAAKITQSATSQKEWEKVVNQWQTATSLMKSEPPANPNHAIVKKQINENKKK
jgi:hypothetical protein